MKPSLIILGAGISGLTLGWKMAEKGFPVTILEAESQVGGLSGSIREKGYSIDFGPHSFFTDDQEIHRVFCDLFQNSLPPLDRKVQFYYQGKYLDYPLNAKSVFLDMGLLQGIRALLSFLGNQIMPRRKSNADEENVEDWVIQNFGLHLYKTFFKPYTEQFWKIPARELSIRSIPSSTRTGFFRTLKLMLSKKIQSENPNLMERETLPTYYPATGYGELPEKITERFLKAGGNLILGARATGLTRFSSEEYSVEYNQSQQLSSNRLVSTLPLPVLFQIFSAPEEIKQSANKLKYRPLVVLGLALARKNVLKGPMYVYYLDRPYNRITETTRFSTQTCPSDKNLITIEIPCGWNDTTWHESKEFLLEKCLPFLEKDGIVGKEEIEDLFLVKTKYAYPIYLKGYEKPLSEVMNYLSTEPNFYTLGRSGEFRYMDADRCMKSALDLSEKILNRSKVPARGLSRQRLTEKAL